LLLSTLPVAQHLLTPDTGAPAVGIVLLHITVPLDERQIAVCATTPWAAVMPMRVC
jgi:hypothetical protein